MNEELKSRARKATNIGAFPEEYRWLIRDLLAELEKRAEQPKPEPVAKVDAPCSCGLHQIPSHVDGVKWYWQLHQRDACTLELPNERCWCGLLRSEHLKGHADTAPPAIPEADRPDVEAVRSGRAVAISPSALEALRKRAIPEGYAITISQAGTATSENSEWLWLQSPRGDVVRVGENGRNGVGPVIYNFLRAFAAKVQRP